MKKVHTMIYICIVTCILMFLSTYIPNVYKIEKQVAPMTIYENIIQHYQTLLPKEEEVIQKIVMLSDIEKKTSGEDIQKRALSQLNNVRTQTLSEEEKKNLAAQMQTMYDIELEPLSVEGKGSIIQMGSAILIVLLTVINLLISWKSSHKAKKA